MQEATKSTKESAKAREACEQYLLLGPERSLSKLAAAMGKRPGYVQVLKDWSRDHGWQERAREYDKEQAAKRRLELEEARREMDKEHALWGKEQALLAIQAIKDLLERKDYNLSSANQLFKISVDLQRLAMGSATEQIALTGNKDADPIDVIVETFWGRGTDPRKGEGILSEPRNEPDDPDDEEDAELTIEIDDEDL